MATKTFILKGKEFTTADGKKKFDKYAIETDDGKNFGFAFRDATKVDKTVFKVPFALAVQIDLRKMSFKDKVVENKDGSAHIYTTVYADIDDIKVLSDQSIIETRAEQKMLAKLNAKVTE